MIKNQTAVITGCNRGIGLSILNKFAKEGYEIICCNRTIDNNFKQHCKLLEKEFKIKIYLYKINFEDLNETKSISKDILANHKNINTLVNNAGYLKQSIFEMIRYEDLKKTFDINLFNQLIFTQNLIKILKKTENSNIIFISSTSGFESNIGRSVYSMSKISLISITKNLSQELSRYKIRVNCVAPGMISTDMMFDNTPKNIIEENLKRVPLNRLGTPDEISNVVFFLSSDNSSYINGQTLRVDGGMN
tara:strand:+ start:86 stop:829 length:744 start_codon:yes stop_codon:yes gene_type:complete